MKRIWMSALLLLTALFAARAQAETVYDRGTMYGVMTVYEQPDSLSDVRMVYFSERPSKCSKVWRMVRVKSLRMFVWRISWRGMC